MMVPSSTMFGMTPYAPVNVYTAPPAAPIPVPSSMPDAEVELKQVPYENIIFFNPFHTGTSTNLPFADFRDVPRRGQGGN